MEKSWTKPKYKDKRIGFEMTLYILNIDGNDQDKTKASV